MHLNPNKKKWAAKCTNVYIGTFATEIEAAKAYDKKAYEVFGDNAILNFPEDIEENKEEVNNGK